MVAPLGAALPEFSVVIASGGALQRAAAVPRRSKPGGVSDAARPFSLARCLSETEGESQ